MTYSPQVSENEDVAYEVCSIASTNETTGDLPGPGRVLGNVYGYLGKKVEEGLGSIAEKFGHGPRATALKIKRIHDDEALSHIARQKKLRKQWNHLESYTK